MEGTITFSPDAIAFYRRWGVEVKPVMTHREFKQLMAKEV